MSDSGRELLTFDGVTVISDGPVRVCEYQGTRFVLPKGAAEPGTTIHKPGDVGALVIQRTRAEAIGLDLL